MKALGKYIKDATGFYINIHPANAKELKKAAVIYLQGFFICHKPTFQEINNFYSTESEAP